MIKRIVCVGSFERERIETEYTERRQSIVKEKGMSKHLVKSSERFGEGIKRIWGENTKRRGRE